LLLLQQLLIPDLLLVMMVPRMDASVQAGW
jgi:hypothetical protein